MVISNKRPKDGTGKEGWVLTVSQLSFKGVFKGIQCCLSAKLLPAGFQSSPLSHTAPAPKNHGVGKELAALCPTAKPVDDDSR